jgi:hypothetical protein
VTGSTAACDSPELETATLVLLAPNVAAAGAEPVSSGVFGLWANRSLNETSSWLHWWTQIEGKLRLRRQLASCATLQRKGWQVAPSCTMVKVFQEQRHRCDRVAAGVKSDAMYVVLQPLKAFVGLL